MSVDFSSAVMAANESECIRLLQKCSTDTERIAALTLLPNILLASDESVLFAVSEFLDVEFIRKLLLAEEGESPNEFGVSCYMFKAISASIMNCFLRSENVRKRRIFQRCVPATITATNLLSEQYAKSENLHELDQVLKDLLFCLHLFLRSNAEISADNLEALAEIILQFEGNRRNSIEVVCDVALSFLWYCRPREPESSATSALTANKVQMILKVIVPTSVSVCELSTQRLKELRLVLDAWLKNLFPSGSVHSCPTWLCDLRILLRTILQSHADKSVKSVSVSLVACLFHHVGYSGWLQSDPQFLQILSSLASIELYADILPRLMEESPDAEIITLTSSCCLILEHAVQIIRSQDDDRVALPLPEAQQSQIVNTLVEAMRYVGEFLLNWHKTAKTSTSSTAEYLQCIFPLFRFICCFLCEDVELFREELLIGLPALISIAKLFPNQSLDAPEKTASYSDAVCLLLPGLSHMSADNQLVPVMVDAGVHMLLFEQLRKVLHSGENCIDNVERYLLVLLDLLIAVGENTMAQCVVNSGFIDDLLSYLLSCFSTVLERFDSKTAAYQLIAVSLQSLLLLLTQAERPLENLEVFEAAQRYLHSHIPVQLLREGTTEERLTTEFDDDTEIWCLCFQLLVKLCKNATSARISIQSGDWVPQMHHYLQKASGRHARSCIATNYSSLLSVLAEH